MQLYVDSVSWLVLSRIPFSHSLGVGPLYILGAAFEYTSSLLFT